MSSQKLFISYQYKENDDATAVCPLPAPRRQARERARAQAHKEQHHQMYFQTSIIVQILKFSS
jgi:hypothetical protein